MFKNANIYRLDPAAVPTLQAITESLDRAPFVPCGATQDKSVGWVSPRGTEHDMLAESIGGQIIMCLRIETKSVPSSAVKQLVKKMVDEVEATTGRVPGRKETKALREDAMMMLLPQAFPKQSSVFVWIDPANGWLVTDASSQGKQDEVVTALVQAIDGLQLQWLQTTVSPLAAMTKWLTAMTPIEWPGAFSIERACELVSGDEEKSVVKFNRHNLVNEEVREHIAQGKLPKWAAMSWDGRIGFVLTEGMQLKKITLLEGVLDGRIDDEDWFDADAAIITGELQKLVPALIDALGGEL